MAIVAKTVYKFKRRIRQLLHTNAKYLQALGKWDNDHPDEDLLDTASRAALTTLGNRIVADLEERRLA